MVDQAFDVGWLRLREPVDHRSRARWPLGLLRREGRRRGWSRVADLGCGTGSNLRYMAARIPWANEWTVVDHDPALLDALQAPVSTLSVRRVQADLATEGLDAVDGCHVATGAALLDLVSEAWLRGLRDRCRDAGCAAYFVLTYDGTVTWSGETDGDDGLVLDAVNEHQRWEKGMGPACGPTAADVARSLFDEAGYRTFVEESPWRLGGGRDLPLLERLVEGWVEAAAEVRPDDEERIRTWARRRLGLARDGRAAVRVGHVDLLALPPEPAAQGRGPPRR